MTHLQNANPEAPMHTALDAYLSDMPESQKLAIVRSMWKSYAVCLDSVTGSSIIETWENEENAEIDSAFAKAGW